MITLSTWEHLAIEVTLREAVRQNKVEQISGRALLAKLETATNIRLAIPDREVK